MATTQTPFSETGRLFLYEVAIFRQLCAVEQLASASTDCAVNS